LKNKCTKEEFQTFSGQAIEWLMLECFVFGFFVCTMMLTMVKSRFISVGMDNTKQFCPLYMSLIANKI